MHIHFVDIHIYVIYNDISHDIILGGITKKKSYTKLKITIDRWKWSSKKCQVTHRKTEKENIKTKNREQKERKIKSDRFFKSQTPQTHQ